MLYRGKLEEGYNSFTTLPPLSPVVMGRVRWVFQHSPDLFFIVAPFP